MKRAEFLETLLAQLTEIAPEDRVQVEDYYNELICDGVESGRDEEEMIAGFGAPKTVAKQILLEYGKTPQSAQTNVGPQAYAAKEDVHTVVLQAENIRVDVIPAAQGPVRVLFEPRQGMDVITCAEQDGKFLFTHKMRNVFSWNWRDLFRLVNGITLEVPADFTGELCVKTTNAAVCISGFTQLSKAQIVSSNARVSAEDLGCALLSVKTSNGALHLLHLRGDKLQAVTDNGRVSAEDCTFSGCIALQTKNGAVDGKRLTSEDIMLKTSNGAVTGTVIGDMRDYAIESRTVNGANNLPNCCYPDQTKRLIAKTINGRIDIQFIY